MGQPLACPAAIKKSPTAEEGSFQGQNRVSGHSGEEGAGPNALKSRTRERCSWEKCREAKAGQEQRVLGNALNRSEDLSGQFGEMLDKWLEQRVILAAVAAIKISYGVFERMFK